MSSPGGLIDEWRIGRARQCATHGLPRTENQMDSITDRTGRNLDRQTPRTDATLPRGRFAGRARTIPYRATSARPARDPEACQPVAAIAECALRPRDDYAPVQWRRGRRYLGSAPGRGTNVRTTLVVAPAPPLCKRESLVDTTPDTPG